MPGIILKLILGLLFFFAGLYLAEKGLIKGTGKKLQQILGFCTSNLISAVITGTVVTAIIQSSSAVSVMIIGLITGGVMTLYQGMGVILGANIGTTVTLHILTLHVDSIEWWLLGAGVLLMIFGWVESKIMIQNGGLVISGFGLIFLGITVLEAAVTPLQFHPQVMSCLIRFGVDPVSGIICGLILTAIIQSSSAVSGIVLVIATQGMINLAGAVGIILGANIGTCMTALLAAFKASPLGRRVAYFHVLFNCFGVLVFLPFINSFIKLISSLAFDLGSQIAFAHTLFNLITVVIILPLVKPIEKMLTNK